MKKISLLLALSLIGLVFYNSNRAPIKNEMKVSKQSSMNINRPNKEKAPKVLFQNIKQQETKTDKSQDSPPKENLRQKSSPERTAFDEHSVTKEGQLVIDSLAIVDEYALAHGDVIMGSYEEMLEFEQRGELPKLEAPGLWKDGIISYEIDSSYETPERITRVLDYFTEETSIQFRKKDDSDEDYVIFKSGDEHCFAHYGRQGGAQEIVLSAQCKEREIAHEIMHTLGFLHEQNREDRDQYIKIHWDNIDENYHDQFKKIPDSFLNTKEAEFDLRSTMMYPPFSFSLFPDTPSITQKDGTLYQQTGNWLSEGDLKKIETLYRR